MNAKTPDGDLKQAQRQALQQRIPWWSDIGPAVTAELQLPALHEQALHGFDVVVIGAGVAGLSAALAIKQRDASLRVLVLEKEEMLGLGATGRNAGIFTPGVNMAFSEMEPGDPARSFYPETTTLFHRLIAEAQEPGALLSAQQTGAINMATSKRAAQKLAWETEERNAAGLRAELWSPAQVAGATQGRLNTRPVVNAMWLPDEGRIHPLTLLAHLARRARQFFGVTIVGQALVTTCEPTTDRTSPARWRLSLANGKDGMHGHDTIQTHAVVNCAGPTDGANARIYALAFAADFPDDFPLFWDASPYTYADYRPGNGRLGVSGGRYGKAGVTTNDASYYRRLADATRGWVPELAYQQPAYTWAVDLYVTSGLLPHLRLMDAGGRSAPGVAIEGLGAHGVLPSMVLARQAADYLVKRL
ncbi:MAG TPA: FAD-dependent oxidoreductase [Ktedonobacteraceae bacterium]|nr:FAD-dependent oxidoreductase [Ktedonobacteraceae bacterium]